jgi:uncharacterized membrane protein
MAWLQYGGNAVYVPAHARPSILARLLGLAGLGGQVMTMAMGSQCSTFAQVNRAEPEADRVPPPSDDRHDATSLFSWGLDLNAGYYVAHAGPDHTDPDRAHDERPETRIWPRPNNQQWPSRRSETWK